ncbi:MAG: hypothetical protein K9M81_03705 [Chthoniobacterales bacterium]|nr:hypothetical protein [Chthoniobacterales bacterium]
MTRSLPLVLPFQGCPLKPGQSPPRSSDRRWFLHQDSRRLATNQYEISGLKAVPPRGLLTAVGASSAFAAPSS